MEKKEFAFKRGMNQVKKKHLIKIRKDIMMALNLSTNSAFYKRMRGEVEPKISEARKICNIFENYGINEIWGES
jgi:hypothetical protein